MALSSAFPGITTLLAVVLLSAGRSFAHDGHPAPIRAVPPADLHRATLIPDRIVLTWTGDPATTQAVTWRSSTEVTRGVAQLGLASDRAQTSASEFATTPVRHETQFGPVHYHTVEFQSLLPDTLYAYRVGDGVNWSEWFHFRTARSEPAPFTFVYFGDAQNDIRTHWSRIFREAFREAPRAAFTLHAGDLINRAENDAEWGEWFAAPAWVNGSIPVVATPGNHEYFNLGAGPAAERIWNTKAGGTVRVTVDIKVEKDAQGKTLSHTVQARAANGGTASATLDAREIFTAVDGGFTTLTGFTLQDLTDREPDNPPLRDRPANPGVRTLSRHWTPQFALPRNGPAGLEETVYFIDYQGARIISLNSNERQSEQVPWLRKVLSENRQRWTIITFHHPIFSPAKGRDNAELRAAWKPLFDEFKVDLVLTGHDHTYARSGDVSGRMSVGTLNVPQGYTQAYDPAIGTVYVVSVSGPKMYDLTNDSWAVRTAEDTQLFQIITVDGPELRYLARTATNRLYDQFTLIKRPGQPNQLVEALPPERRRSSGR
ncbi:MAG: fibronectin type III domain-containing protein [Opitutaceae bacterium]|nr:fibronectin type III domain-containing protein [Opitutaceae bacterium]